MPHILTGLATFVTNTTSAMLHASFVFGEPLLPFQLCTVHVQGKLAVVMRPGGQKGHVTHCHALPVERKHCSARSAIHDSQYVNTPITMMLVATVMTSVSASLLEIAGK